MDFELKLKNLLKSYNVLDISELEKHFRITIRLNNDRYVIFPSPLQFTSLDMQEKIAILYVLKEDL